MPTVTEAHDQKAWNSFLAAQTFRPFLQSWEMGEVYRDLGQDPLRMEIREGDNLVGIGFGHVVPARRGRHLIIPYGPVMSCQLSGVRFQETLHALMRKMTHIAKENGCSFIRLSPFWPQERFGFRISDFGFRLATLHLLAEHIWYLPLVEQDPWEKPPPLTPPTSGSHLSRVRERGLGGGGNPRNTEDIFKSMRATTRNLIRRAEKEGVTITESDDPIRDLPIFLTLHDETRRRHRFTPYTDAFFHAQVKQFSPLPAHRFPLTAPHCSLYLARYRDEVIASSIHVHFAGETSYHHGASTERCRNIPASYLLQWRAIQDAIARRDHTYNFWGIAPPHSSRHPFAGVTLFKTGFGGKAVELTHCMDLPLKPSYYLTRGFEVFRKWRRGF